MSVFHTAVNSVVKRTYDRSIRLRYGGTTDIMKEDWDNLILLDACRLDAFKKVNSIEGRLETRVSKGSMSREFIKQNFHGKVLHDTVYITANPFVGYVEENTFHALINLLNEWDESLQTVHPKAVHEVAVREHERYADKRIIIHMMQPHQPYLGQKATEIKEQIESHLSAKGWDNNIRKEKSNFESRLDGIKQIEAPKYPELDVTESDIQKAYMETLNIAMSYVESLVEKFDGKTVITSDHGELIGEKIHPLGKKWYGHPAGCWRPEVRRVPWFVINDERRNIISDTPKIQESKSEQLDEKLEKLGYK